MDKISVIIISYNRPDETLDAIDNILSLQDEKSLIDEIIIINNASNSDYSAVREKVQETNSLLTCRYIELEKNLGVAGGRNVGIREAKNEGLLFVDDDAVFENKNIIEEICFLTSKDPNIGILAFLSKNYYTKEINLNEFPHHNKKLIHKNSFYTYYYVGVAHYIKRDVFKKVGYYPEDFFYGMEEYDLSYRALDNGFKIFYSNALTVLHKKVQKGRQSNERIKQKLAENKIKVALRNLPSFLVITHIALWSLKYLKESNLNFIGLYQIYKNIYLYTKKGFYRKPISKSTLVYIKEVGGIIYY